MKNRRLLGLALVTALVSFCSNAVIAAGGYSARLLSPQLGQVVRPGQVIKIEWKSQLPHTDAGGCEMELWLSLDGGRTFSTCITPQVPPKTTSFNWTVPNTPTNAAVLDIRFGCEWYYPESYAPQPASTFVIAAAAPAVTN